jgi:hypothetical protein
MTSQAHYAHSLPAADNQMSQDENPYQAPQQMRQRKVNRELLRLRLVFGVFILIAVLLLLARFAVYNGLW